MILSHNDLGFSWEEADAASGALLIGRLLSGSVDETIQAK